ncbi:branched-chain amino acid ABC transporter substrate-binding protein [Acidovorax sp.]|uniref:branched-chain amino acid ABC transporter substrate-binding protein n=1 Tax=Acidovorax sp. TaxID=1872122 RepID=UPI002ACDD73B|nr:branched-chain amino acid ABC transporter substrate-binding protein [Acidovorax sp.]MDZ7862948.1 branched-chain amino acid ABC transporter substrate-binding protein [Acidovorax sp.]
MNFRHWINRAAIAVATLAGLLMSATAHAEAVRIAMIETFSGAFAPLGQNQLSTLRMAIGMANAQRWAGQHSFEVTPFDGKGSPQESLVQLKLAIDQGFRIIAQGNGSGVAAALIDAVNKHNERNPGKEVIFLNYQAIDPDLTNSRCSFWHFRFDANSDMKMEALTSYMAKDAGIRKVYLINQNYSHGHQVTRAAKELLKRKRPDVQIAGDDLHPIATVKDFSPYVAKIRASGADTIITGNWGTDLALLIKAALESDLKAQFYTYYAASSGVPTAMGAAAAGSTRQISYWTPNNETFAGKDLAEAFRREHGDDLVAIGIHTMVQMLARAIAGAGSVEPLRIAYALEGMKFQAVNGEVEMRAGDHQLLQPLYISTWSKVDGKKVQVEQEKTGHGWRLDARLDAYVASQPHSCQMRRPPRAG